MWKVALGVNRGYPRQWPCLIGQGVCVDVDGGGMGKAWGTLCCGVSTCVKSQTGRVMAMCGSTITWRVATGSAPMWDDNIHRNNGCKPVYTRSNNLIQKYVNHIQICKSKDKWASSFSRISDEVQKCLQLSSHFYHYSSVPALAQALAMPLLEETTEPQEHPPTVPVVIIGKRFALSVGLGHTLKS